MRGLTSEFEPCVKAVNRQVRLPRGGPIRQIARQILLLCFGILTGHLAYGHAPAFAGAEDSWPEVEGGELAAEPCQTIVWPLASPFANIQIFPGNTIWQTEMSIACIPSNPAVLLVGANTFYVTQDSTPAYRQGSYHSEDGGLTWSGNDTLPREGYADPCVVFSANGIAYHNSLHADTIADRKQVWLWQSSDRGLSWSFVDSVPNTFSTDKNHMAIDLTESAHLNSIYLAYSDDPSQSSHPDIFLSFMLPLTQRLSEPVQISLDLEPDYSQRGVNVAIGEGGEVYASWARYSDYNESHGEGEFWFREFAAGLQNADDPYSIPGLNVKGIRGELKLTAEDSTHRIRVNSFPSMAVDTSSGPFRGTIYLVWADKRNGQPDIYLTKRDPSTHNWSAPIRVDSDSTGKDQWFPWVSVDPNGYVHVVFYDSRVDTANSGASNLMTAVYMATSRNGGSTFDNYLISNAAFSPCNIYDRGLGAGTGFAGDYIGLTSDRRHAYPCWNDNRTGIHQAYMACVPIPIHIDSNTHWTGAVTLERQVIVDSGATLYVDSGAVVSVATEYGPCAKIAITVAKGGALSAYKASFVSAAQTPAAGDWQ